MDQLIQIAGALLILAAYGAAQFGWLPVSSVTYLVLNLVGSAILGVLAVIEDQWGFLLLEGAWALISLWSLAELARGREVGPTHRSASS